MTNKIDITTTAEQNAGATAALEGLIEAMPYLITLTPTERRRMLKMGERTEGFARTALEAAAQFPGAIPPGLDTAQLTRDLGLRDNLAGMELALGSLLQKVRDTRIVAGSDLYSGALDIYQALQRHGFEEGVDAAVNQLSLRFRRTAATEPTPTEPPVGE